MFTMLFHAILLGVTLKTRWLLWLRLFNLVGQKVASSSRQRCYFERIKPLNNLYSSWAKRRQESTSRDTKDETGCSKMLGETPDLLEFLRGLPTPICLLLFVPFVLLTSQVSPVYGIKEFPVFRMQQFDMHGTKYGKYELGNGKNWQN